MFSSGSSGIEQEWQQVRELLRREFGETAFGTWLKPIELVDLDGDQVILSVPTLFMRDWLIQHYADRIRVAWTKTNTEVRTIILNVRAPTTGSQAATGSQANGTGDAGPSGSGTSGGQNPAVRPIEPTSPPNDAPHPTSPDQRMDKHADGGSGMGAHHGANSQGANNQGANNQGMGGFGEHPAGTSYPVPDDRSIVGEFGIRLDPRMTFESFVVGKPNEFAVAAAERVAQSLKPPFNPLFLYGGVGLGKTHLMHAIAARAKEIDPSRRVVYLSAEKFMYQFVRALRHQDTIGFKEMFRSVDMLMVDDVQFISDKESTQEEFFHTFNTLIERGRQIVISADRSPADLSGLQERIRSRLGWGLCADIHPTTYELRLGILQSKAEQLKVSAPVRVLEFLASRITSNVRELEGALNRIVHHAGLFHRPISLEMAQDILRDQIRSHDRRVTIEDIQKVVVEHYGIRISDMHSSRRQRSVARPRQVAMYLSKKLTSQSLPEIGKKFGNRDHTTVMHAVKKIEDLIERERNMAEDVEQLVRSLKG